MTKVFDVVVKLNGVESHYNNKAQAILAIITDLSQAENFAEITKEEFEEVRQDLKLLRDTEKAVKVESDFISFSASLVNQKRDRNLNKQETGYVFSTDLPKTFRLDHNIAKADLLFEVLEIYSEMNEFTSEIRTELLEDFKTLLYEKEPYIPGCGMITEVEI
jgi:hypothetical protein